MTEQKHREFNINDFRKAAEMLKRAKVLTKEVKFWKVPIKNWELFNHLKEDGRIRQTRPGGPWELCD